MPQEIEMQTVNSAQLEYGMECREHTVQVINRTGSTLSKGDVVMFDIKLSSTEATSNSPGKDSSGLANVVAPSDAAADFKFAQFAVITSDTIADNASGTAAVRGQVDAFVIKASGSIAAGDPLGVDANKNLTADITSGDKIVGRAAVAATTPATRTRVSCLFEGIFALGVQ